MKLEIIRGKEYSLVVEDAAAAVTQDGFWKSSYLKAFEALEDYISNADKVRDAFRNSVAGLSSTEILYRSPQNIIAFSGERGSGKTSTMLSFSDALKDADKLEKLNNYSKKKIDRSFIVLDPIDPTVLEDGQSILSVFLSKLLFIAEKYWKKPRGFGQDISDMESMKTQLLSCARQCLNGICAVKEKKGVPQNLAELQRIGDSSILKKNFFEFVERFMAFCGGNGQCPSEKNVVVFQIDDTDCQICRGYEVLEDIRKYLTIPNVVILMATDTELLRQVLVRHYLTDFSKNIEEETMKVHDLKGLGEKYMVKLLPPTHVVYLPNIDEFIRDKMNKIRLRYIGEGGENLLRGPGEKKIDGDDDFQALVLRYIYRKTHIVFTSHDAYANNIIPTTLRGLAHLLNLLSAMEDVPEVDFKNKVPGESETEHLIGQLERQIPVLERNLNLFEQYFLNDWVQAKLPRKTLGFIRSLADKVPGQRIPFIAETLRKYYYSVGFNSHDDADPTELPPCLDGNIFSYRNIDEALRWVLGTVEKAGQAKAFRNEEDFYFIFAIRTLLTIENNKDVLKAKRKAVESYRAQTGEGRKDQTDEAKIVFDYFKEKTSLPDGFFLDAVDLYGFPLVEDNEEKGGSDGSGQEKTGQEETGQIEIGQEESRKAYSQSKYFWGAKGIVNLHFWGGIVEWLAPQEDTLNDLSQSQIYRAQELAVLVAANCDVQEVARKDVAKTAKIGTSKEDSLRKAVEKGLGLVQDAVAKLNQGMLDTYRRKPASEEPLWKIGKSREIKKSGEIKKSDADILDQYEAEIKKRRKAKKKAEKQNKEIAEKTETRPELIPVLEINIPVSADSAEEARRELEMYCCNVGESTGKALRNAENMRNLLDQLENCARQLKNYLNEEEAERNEEDYAKIQRKYKEIKMEWNMLVEEQNTPAEE